MAGLSISVGGVEAPGEANGARISPQWLRGEMRNCLPDPKPEFTAALHYGCSRRPGERRGGLTCYQQLPASVISHRGFLPRLWGGGCGRHRLVAREAWSLSTAASLH
jgi:hypothetical protein